MKAKQLAEGIYWVGAIDWNIRNFHGYLTQRGTTYNAYLVIDEKITLIDTVKPGFEDDLIKRISSVIDPSKIDYVVSNHVEMDHSGGLPAIMKLAPNATIITCANGEKGLKTHYKEDWKFKTFDTDETISLGKRSLKFYLTPMVHWPDNMVTYMPEEKILFSNDSLGQHYASSGRFDTEEPIDIIMEEAKKYYANIVLPYGNQVKKELALIGGLEFKMILPSHGVGWKENIGQIINKYVQWSSNETKKKAVVIYDTMWKSTEKMAEVVQSAFDELNYLTTLRNLQYNHISDIMTDLIDAEYICVGSPTLNTTMMPSVAAFLTYLKGLCPGERKAVAFGSFGWGGQGVKNVHKWLEEMKFDVIESPRLQFIPNENDLEELKEVLKAKILEKSVS